MKTQWRLATNPQRQVATQNTTFLMTELRHVHDFQTLGGGGGRGGGGGGEVQISNKSRKCTKSTPKSHQESQIRKKYWFPFKKYIVKNQQHETNNCLFFSNKEFRVLAHLEDYVFSNVMCGFFSQFIHGKEHCMEFPLKGNIIHITGCKQLTKEPHSA